MKLFTLDFDLKDISELNNSVEESRKILDNFKENGKILGYYIMRYPAFLGIKILIKDGEEKVVDEVEGDLKDAPLLEKTMKKEDLGAPKDNIPELCCLSMEHRNKVWDLLNRKPSEEEFVHLVHYTANPLLLDDPDEISASLKLIHSHLHRK